VRNSTTLESLVSSYRQASTLHEKAILERRIWDGHRPKGAVKGPWLHELLGAPESEIISRSNLLKEKGGSHPDVWGLIHGPEDYPEVIKILRNSRSEVGVESPGVLSVALRIRPEAPTVKPKKSAKVNTGSTKRTGSTHKNSTESTRRSEGKVDWTQAVAELIEKQGSGFILAVVETVNRRYLEEGRPPPGIPESPQPQPDPKPSQGHPDSTNSELEHEVRRLLFAMLDSRNLVENPYGVHDLLMKTSQDFVRGLRRIKKVSQVKLPLVDKLPSAFAALGLPLQDPSSPSFDLAPVRAAFKAEASRTHPDRAGPDVAPGSFQKVREAWETISKAYNRAKQSRS